MLGRWRRVGNYSNIKRSGLHKVSFIADSVAAVITRLDINTFECKTDGNFDEITLVFSPVYQNELLAVCKALSIIVTSKQVEVSQMPEGLPCHLDMKMLCADIYSVKANFDSDLLTKLLKLFDHFNQRLQPHPFPQELIDELNNAHQTIRNCAVYREQLRSECLSRDFIKKYYHSINPRKEYLNIVSSFVSKHKHIIASDIKDKKTEYTLRNPQFPNPAAKYKFKNGIITQREPNYVWRGFDNLMSMGYFQNFSPFFSERLIRGKDPDHVDKGMQYPILTQAILYQPYNNSDAMNLLLWYKADPFKRAFVYGFDDAHWYSFSPFEMALAFGINRKLDYIIDQCSQLDKRSAVRVKSHENYKIVQSWIEFSNQSICSHFRFTNGKVISTRLLAVNNLQQEERRAVYQLFEDNFQAPDDFQQKKLKDIFEKDFSGEKHIDLIYSGKEIIGFNLLEFINAEQHENTLLVHCEYAAIKPEYRGYGLMVLLSFRMAYIMQLLFPEKHVGIFFFSLHYNSYRMVDFKHYPKYQSKVMDSIVKNMLDAICDANYFYYHHLITNYIIDTLRVRASRENERDPSLNEYMFLSEILGLNKEQINQFHTRSAPIAFMVGDDNYLHMSRVSETLGLDFDEHIAEYAKLLHYFL